MRLFSVFVTFLLSFISVAQVGIGTTNPSSSAVLDLTSTTQGFLAPRMTLAQRAAVNPVEGLMVYVTDVPCYSLYQQGEWRCMDVVSSPLFGTVGSFTCNDSYVSGSLSQGVMAQNTQLILPYVGGNGGWYASQTIVSSGVTGLTARLFAGVLNSGVGSLTLYLSGTPLSSGNALFTFTLGSSTCTLTVPVSSSSTTAASVIGSISCTAVTAPYTTLVTGKAIPSGYTFSIPYTGGDGSTYSATIPSYTHPGVVAIAAPQVLSPSGGSVLYTLSGTPATEGALFFSISIGNQNCVYNGLNSTRGLQFGTATASASAIVPAGINRATLKVWGAAGKSDGGYYGGFGGYVRATVTVTPGETLTVRVGGGGTANTTALNGGGLNGGGGYSGVFRGSTPLVIAGGGGGTGNNDLATAGRECSYIYGGSAGYPSGLAGGRFANGGVAGTGFDTTGGSATAGGTGGNGTNNGSAYQGGAGFSGGSYSGGGGGGGYFGGGGGTNRSSNVTGDDGGGGGAGGSGYIIPSATSITTISQSTCVSSSSVNAPGSDDVDYGTGTPAKPISQQAGSNGRVVILYDY